MLTIQHLLVHIAHIYGWMARLS